MSDVQPVHMAEAIAELGRERVLEARRYLDAWESLTRSGVPVHDVRHVLDRPAQHTSALTAIEVWERGNGRGLLGLVGERGLGKSWAAAHWLLGQHRRGKPGRWLACSSWARRGWDNLRDEVAECTRSRALVIDDLGAGNSDSDVARQWINGLLLERFSYSLPTILISNGTRRDLAAWMDPRQESRLDEAGDIPILVGDSMREPDRDKLDDHGHGPRWIEARAIVDLLGCDHEPAATGEHRDGPSVMQWIVGRELAWAASKTSNAKAGRLLDLRQNAVGRLAAEKAANDQAPALLGELEGAIQRLAGSMSREQTDAILARDRRDRAIAENAERSRICYGAMQTKVGRRTGLPWESAAPLSREGRPRVRVEDGAPKWAAGDDARVKLKGLGFKVSGEPGRIRVTHGEQVKFDGVASVASGWELAASLCGAGW